MGNKAAAQVGTARSLEPRNSDPSKVANDYDHRDEEWAASAGVTAGSVYSLGFGMQGQLGLGVKDNCTLPAEIAPHLDEQCVVAVAGGISFSIALIDDGAVYIWGETNLIRTALVKVDDPVATAVPRRISTLSDVIVTCVSAAGYHVVVASDTGRVYTWGHGKHGQLGHGNRNDQVLPVAIAHLQSHHVVTCATGPMHSSCVTLGGGIYLWGSGLFGQIGSGERKDSLLPRLCKYLLPTKVTDPRAHEVLELRVVTVACGGAHSLAIYGAGQVYSWGRGRGGALGHGGEAPELVPRRIDAFHEEIRVVAIAAAGAHSFAITADGDLYSWGRSGIHGVLGLAPASSSSSMPSSSSSAFDADAPPSPFHDNGPTKSDDCGGGGGATKTAASKSASGPESAAATDTDDSAMAVRRSSRPLTALMIPRAGGKMAPGVAAITTPQRVHIAGADGVPVSVKSVSTSKGHTLVVSVDGRVWGFGYNGFGQMLLDTTRLPPTHHALTTPATFDPWMRPRLMKEFLPSRRVVQACAAPFHTLLLVALTTYDVQLRRDAQDGVVAAAFWERKDAEQRVLDAEMFAKAEAAAHKKEQRHIEEATKRAYEKEQQRVKTTELWHKERAERMRLDMHNITRPQNSRRT